MKRILQFLLEVAVTIPLSSQNPEAPSCLDYTNKSANNDMKNSELLDYSYVGYHFSEKALSDASSWNTISVVDYCTTVNDDTYDDGIYAPIEAAKTANVS